MAESNRSRTVNHLVGSKGRAKTAASKKSPRGET